MSQIKAWKRRCGIKGSWLSRAMVSRLESTLLAKRPRPTILLVEDDEALANALRFRLELEGWPVLSYPSAEAILATKDLPERACLVLDHMLTGMRGLDLLSELRTRSVTYPAIIITTNPSRAFRERVVASGATLIEKPLLGDGLDRAIRAVLSE